METGSRSSVWSQTDEKLVHLWSQFRRNLKSLQWVLDLLPVGNVWKTLREAFWSDWFLSVWRSGGSTAWRSSSPSPTLEFHHMWPQKMFSCNKIKSNSTWLNSCFMIRSISVPAKRQFWTFWANLRCPESFILQLNQKTSPSAAVCCKVTMAACFPPSVCWVVKISSALCDDPSCIWRLQKGWQECAEGWTWRGIRLRFPLQTVQSKLKPNKRAF